MKRMINKLYQGEFMKESTNEVQVMVLKDLISTYWEFDKTNYLLFINVRRAYDSIIKTSGIFF